MMFILINLKNELNAWLLLLVDGISIYILKVNLRPFLLLFSFLVTVSLAALMVNYSCP